MRRGLTPSRARMAPIGRFRIHSLPPIPYSYLFPFIPFLSLFAHVVRASRPLRPGAAAPPRRSVSVGAKPPKRRRKWILVEETDEFADDAAPEGTEEGVPASSSPEVRYADYEDADQGGGTRKVVYENYSREDATVRERGTRVG